MQDNLLTLEKLFEQLYPEDTSVLAELRSLKGLRERPDYHPEPSAYVHIQIVTNRAYLTNIPEMIATAFFHDIGKWALNRINPRSGYPTAPGHDVYGAKLALKYPKFSEALNADPSIVSEMCGQHMRINQIDEMKEHKAKALRDSPHFSKFILFAQLDDMTKRFSHENKEDTSTEEQLNQYRLDIW